MKKKRLRTWAIIVAGAVVVAWVFLGSRGSDAQPPQYEMASAERGPLAMTVSTTGRVVANLDVDIKCKASGEVLRLPKDVSDRVKKGELLVELDPAVEERRVRQAEVALSASRARVEQARRNLVVAERNLSTDKRRAEAALTGARARAEDARAKADRVKQLWEKKLSSREEYDTAGTTVVQATTELENARVRIDELATQELALDVKRQDVRLAETQVESDEITLADAKERLDDTKILAPLDGVVSVRNVEIGQIIASGINNIGGGSSVLMVSDLSRMFVLADVDESDIGKVEVGQTVSVTADAYLGELFRGTVARIATRGVNTSNVVTFEVKIEVLGENRSLLKPEMTANVEILVARRDDAVLVPVEAVTRRMGEHFVLVEGADGALDERPVEIGIADGVRIEIVSGLKEGERAALVGGGSDTRWRKPEMGSHGPMRMFRRGKERSK